MNSELSDFAAHLREVISHWPSAIGHRPFPELALDLFSLQFKHNPAYRKICETRKATPQSVEHWTQIPAVPTSIFKELALTSIPSTERTAVFHSSGTTEQKPSRHFHCAESLAVYETSLWTWFAANVSGGAPNSSSASFRSDVDHADQEIGAPSPRQFRLAMLTPPPEQVPHSSLVHMFETVRFKLGGASVPASRSEFYGKLAEDGSWTLEFDAVVDALASGCQTSDASPVLLLGTAFS
ncbi:MAG TPA: hypothetical protein VFF11_10495, partial [Candidatus Binatia bacterium]|nr:hypothetical protein [Candidatus Binatia bacterium]